MSTPAQIAANRRNAKRSTGPRTPEGKAKAALNSISYGFAASIYFLEDEDPEEFYALQHALIDEFLPDTSTEQILVEKMALNQWLNLRATRLQSKILVINQPLLTIPKDLGLLIRYQTTADRAFHKAHAELLKAQKERKNQEIGFVSQNPQENLSEAPPETAKNAQPPSNPTEDRHVIAKIVAASPLATPPTVKTAA